MKERPILFSAPMVRAILEGRKTQTRRAVKLPERSSLRGAWEPTTICGEDGNNIIHDDQVAIWHTGTGDVICCPYGIPGDRLWVRETFRFLDAFDKYSPASVGRACLDAGYKKEWAPTQYEADGMRKNWQNVGCTPGSITVGKKRSSLHMPRWASRILLEVVSVRVERMQDISEADAMAEGCDDRNSEAAKSVGWCERPQRAFHRLWEHINGPESWAANPWVWVVEFRRIDP